MKKFKMLEEYKKKRKRLDELVKDRKLNDKLILKISKQMDEIQNQLNGIELEN